MNCPSRADCEIEDDGYNQNPPDLAADLTTNSDLNGVANSREQRDHRLGPEDLDREDGSLDKPSDDVDPDVLRSSADAVTAVAAPIHAAVADTKVAQANVSDVVIAAPKERILKGDAGSPHGRDHGTEPDVPHGLKGSVRSSLQSGGAVLKKFAKFIGPGFMVSVAYIDPGNYATDVAAGATFRYKLLFVILMSNIFAIFLQSLCIRLGTVTGMDLAQNCRAHLPRWLNYVLYVFAEAAIIATDIAEVIGTAIALNLLLKIPLVAGCAISIADVLIILVFYRPSGSMRGLRAFEIFVMLLVLGVVVCFCVELSVIKDTSVGEVFKGYLPSSTLVKAQGLYQSCGILGATVMPHSLYLGSGVVQARLRDFDRKHDNLGPSLNDSTTNPDTTSLHDADSLELDKYRPSLAAIKSCMTFSIVELALALFTFALFVNSAILIVAGASLYNTPNAADADLFGIHDLLSKSLAPAAGTIFALALLLSGTSAGIVCTIAGQIVSEGQLNWSVKPWVRRLMVRSISITPSIIIAGAVGKEGLSTALEASQVALSVILPFVSAPLIYFTCRNKFMTVVAERVEPGSAVGSPNATRLALVDDKGDATAGAQGETGIEVVEAVKMRNTWVVTGFAVAIWGVMVVMNVALLVLLGLGKQ